jgi:putative heme-binding domain-containing protein
MRRLVILVWAGSLIAQEGTRNLRTTPDDIAAGAQTFRSHCAPCHGLKGEGGRGPNLASGRFYHGASDADLLTNISDGIPGTEMPGIFYMEDRIWQVIAYIRSLNASAERPAGDLARGADLFRSKGCIRCHRVSGQGGGFGPDLSQIGKTRSLEHLRQSIVEPDADVQPRYWVASFKDGASKSVEGFVMNEDTYTVQLMDMNQQLHSYEKAAVKQYKVEKTSKMPSYKKLLTGEQLNDLVAYLASLRPE